MLVLRVEHEDGSGPYTTSTLREICERKSNPDLAFDLKGRHPIPYDDSLYRRNSREKTGSEYAFTPREHIFGFEDYRQFRSWFYSDDVLAALSGRNFQLSVYDVPDTDTILGNTQLTFNCETAKKLASLPLNLSAETFQFHLDSLKNQV